MRPYGRNPTGLRGEPRSHIFRKQVIAPDLEPLPATLNSTKPIPNLHPNIQKSRESIYTLEDILTYNRHVNLQPRADKGERQACHLDTCKQPYSEKP